jgi:hypothetical protein
MNQSNSDIFRDASGDYEVEICSHLEGPVRH